MKLNNGKGYQAKSSHSQTVGYGVALPAAAGGNRDSHGQRVSKTAMQTPLNAKPGAQRLSSNNALRPAQDTRKRLSTAQDTADIQGSTTAQYGQSKPNLHNASALQVGGGVSSPAKKDYGAKLNSPLPATPQAAPEERKETFATKMKKLFCCGS